jgi:hypothetical protein
MVVCVLECGIPAAAEPSEYSELSDRELTGLRIKEAGAREEIDRRLDVYTGDEKVALRQRLVQVKPPEDFLSDVSNEELIEIMGYWRAEWLALLAAQTLGARAANATPEERAAIHIELETRARGMVYPEADPFQHDEATLGARWGYDAYMTKAASILPEETALEFLADTYLKEDDFKSQLKFLDLVERSLPAKGAASAASVAVLLDALPEGIDRLPYLELVGEVRVRAWRILGQCGEAGLAVLEKTHWFSSGTGVLAMGRIATERSQTLLVDQYHKFPTDARRLEVLSALTVSLRKRNDPEIRQFVYSELPKYLALSPERDYSLLDVGHAAAVARATQDPQFLLYLESLQSAMTPENLERAREYERSTQSEWTNRVESLDATVEEAVESLKRAAARAAQEPEQSNPADEPIEPQRGTRPRVR